MKKIIIFKRFIISIIILFPLFTLIPIYYFSHVSFPSDSIEGLFVMNSSAFVFWEHTGTIYCKIILPLILVIALVHLIFSVFRYFKYKTNNNNDKKFLTKRSIIWTSVILIILFLEIIFWQDFLFIFSHYF